MRSDGIVRGNMHRSRSRVCNQAFGKSKSCLPFHAIILLAILTPFKLAIATENGGSNYLPGFYGDFGMAAFPGAGTYFSNFFAAYRDEKALTGTLLEMPGLLHVSEQTWLEGRFVSGLFPALMVSHDKSGPGNADRFALGDFYLVPGGLNWVGENFSALLFEGVVVPTGRYQKNDFNTGRNYWTFDHNLLLTFNLPGSNELSVAIGYMSNLKNPATQYRSGDEFHFDFNLGHYFTNGLGLGVSGSHYRQVTADQAANPALIGAPVEASSLGPSVMYAKKLNDQELAVSLKWLYEYDVAGRAVQEYLVCRAMLNF